MNTFSFARSNLFDAEILLSIENYTEKKNVLTKIFVKLNALMVQVH